MRSQQLSLVIHAANQATNWIGNWLGSSLASGQATCRYPMHTSYQIGTTYVQLSTERREGSEMAHISLGKFIKKQNKPKNLFVCLYLCASCFSKLKLDGGRRGPDTGHMTPSSADVLNHFWIIKCDIETGSQSRH